MKITKGRIRQIIAEEIAAMEDEEDEDLEVPVGADIDMMADEEDVTELKVASRAGLDRHVLDHRHTIEEELRLGWENIQTGTRAFVCVRRIHLACHVLSLTFLD